MTRLIYSMLLYFLSPLLVIYFFLRSKKNPQYLSRWHERLGWCQARPTDVLIHSVSLGETQAMLPVLRALHQSYPELTFTVTCSSPTASAKILKELGETVQHFYLPLDFLGAVRRFVDQVQPRLCLVIEVEIWPNLLHALKQQGCQVLLCNARLSEKTFQHYQKIQALMRPALQCFDQILVQTPAEATRFEQLLDATQSLTTAGSLKYDLEVPQSVLDSASSWRRQWMQRSVWCAGSVHPGELESLLQVHHQLLLDQPDALLLIAPRHPENFERCAQLLAAQKLRYQRRSESEQLSPETQVFLIDVIGELMSFYGAASVAFVGGSWIEHGGQNPIEPAALGIPVLMGPSTYNFTEVCSALQECDHLTLVTTQEACYHALCGYFHQPEAALKRGRAGQQWLLENQGALQRHCDGIKESLIKAGLVGRH